MPNDAKIGLVLGVALVLAAGMLFAQKERGLDPAGHRNASASGQTTGRVAEGMTTAASEGKPEESERTPSPYTVQEGDTLAGLAERFYGDRNKGDDIYRANREAISNADQLTPGAVLTIPRLSPSAASADNAGR